jgi:hypothetical protein
MVNNIAEGNTGEGFWASAVEGLVSLINCAGYNNSSNYSVTNITDVQGFIAQTAGSFFTNAASGDFSLNNTAGRGALLRAAAYPGTFPRATTVSYADIGVAQHQDAASAGLACNPLAGFVR